jgi:hypothetical protein
MKALIKQPAGIGDIFFCQKIAQKLHDIGYNVVWPIIPEFMWLIDYLITDATFCSIADEFDNKDLYKNCSPHIFNFSADEQTIIVNLQDADQLFPNSSVMTAKYKAVQLNHHNWLNYFNFNRNAEKENALFYDVLNLKDDSVFALKNYFFASPPNEQICKLAANANIQSDKVICMRNIPEFTLFDWCKVFERAHEIHTVDTSVLLIVEKLNTANKLHLYSRHTPANFMHVLPIISNRWNFIYD